MAGEAQCDDEDDEDHGRHEADRGRWRPPRDGCRPRKRPEAGGERQAGDDDDVGDALDEDRADRARRGAAEVAAQQEGAVEVAELGRHDAVHEPRQEEHLAWRTR